jgi:hypothetical protein
MVVTGFDVNGALHQHSPLEAQLQASLNIVPAHAWYACPHGALTFVNERTADYLGLPKDHPLRFGTGTGAETMDAETLQNLIGDTEKRARTCNPHSVQHELKKTKTEELKCRPT